MDVNWLTRIRSDPRWKPLYAHLHGASGFFLYFNLYKNINVLDAMKD